MLILSLFYGTSVQSADYQIRQGSTLEILFPVHLATKISGTLEGQPLLFSVIRKNPGTDEVITRGEFMHLLYPFLLEKKTDFASSNFPDVPRNHPYYDAIKKAADYQIVNGYVDGRFGAEDTLTRAQAAKIIMKAFPLFSTTETAKNFPDMDDTHPLKVFVDQAVEAGIFKGYPDGNFRPNQALSIAEAQIIIRRGLLLEVKFPALEKFYWRSLVGISRLKPARKVALNLNLAGTSKSTVVEILPRKFEEKSFTITPQKDKLLEKEVFDNTWDIINAARKNSHPKQLWEGTFIVPTTGVKTLGYGDQLTINGKPSGSHFGHDYANETGTPVYAANHGKVVLAQNTPSFGNTIMIDHGQKVFTMYLHNWRMQAKVGDMVKKGQLIAQMGTTGISTGPHLHYSHWVGDTIVDGEEWFAKEY